MLEALTQHIYAYCQGLHTYEWMLISMRLFLTLPRSQKRAHMPTVLVHVNEPSNLTAAHWKLNINKRYLYLLDTVNVFYFNNV